MGASGRKLATSYTTIEWSEDGRWVAKTRRPADDARRRFRYELRVNQLLRAKPPPVPTPVLLDHDATRRSLTFSAVEGDPLGPKYPTMLSPDHLDSIIGLAAGLERFQPRRRWFRHLSSTGRVAVAHRHGLLTDDQAHLLVALARRVHTRHRFAHGDMTARNVLQGAEGTGCALIDWEWAGLYPTDYDLAFLWFSLVDLPGGRDRVEHAVRGDRHSFLLSALLVQLWHLQWYVPAEFREKHVATRDDLLARLCV